MRADRLLLSTLVALGVAACEGGGDDAGDGSDGTADAAPPAPDGAVSPVGEVPATPQRDGDPAAGYERLVNAGYVSCGIPGSVYDQFFGPAPVEARLPGRNAANATLPYDFTRFTAASGIDVVSTNCLACHAGRVNGELVVGLGATDRDFTEDPSALAVLVGNFIPESDTLARAEWLEWSDRVIAIAPYVILDTVGPNPADNLAAALFSHRDRETLAWSNAPLLPLPPPIVVPVDVPPWWRMQKKHAMFYMGAGRGDHARIMMSASALCTDTVDEAAAIDAYFDDVAAYLRAIEPPAWPFPVDAALAAEGRVVFEQACASCHGTYGGGAADGTDGDTYPNLIVAVAEVGTDPTLVTGVSQFAGEYVNWFNDSFYGETAYLAPAPGYYAPPLDGIWATAPYLHNGSVPTLAALLDSGTRPDAWKRSFDSTDYDPAAVGWHFTAVPGGKDGEPDADEKKLVYDTSGLGYGNRGHTYGDGFTPEQRAAVLEYLKTL